MQRKKRAVRPARDRRALVPVAPLKPPQFIPTVKVGHTFRFVTLSGAGYTVNSDDLLNLLLVATAATTTARLLQAVKLKRIRVWGNVPSLGSAPSTVQVEWTSGTGVASFGAAWKVSDTSQGVTSAFVDARAPKGSIADFWLQNGQTNAGVAILTFPTGAVFDFHVTCVFVDTESPTAGQTTTGATVGRVYGGTLSSGATWSPVGLTALP